MNNKSWNAQLGKEKKKENKMDYAPDLENGSLLLTNREYKYKWKTNLLSVLVKDDKYAYLGHQCIAEKISKYPFSHEGLYEAAHIKTWAGNYTLRSCLINSELNCLAQPICDDREIKYLSFQETFTYLKNKNRLYMALTFEQDGSKYTLYTPSCYTNLATEENDYRFIQPISGYVLYEKNDQFHLAYVVAHIKDGICESIQFRIRESYFILGGPKKIFTKLLKWIERKKPHWTLYKRYFQRIDFKKAITPDKGACRFFYYPKDKE